MPSHRNSICPNTSHPPPTLPPTRLLRIPLHKKLRLLLADYFTNATICGNILREVAEGLIYNCRVPIYVFGEHEIPGVYCGYCVVEFDSIDCIGNSAINQTSPAHHFRDGKNYPN